MQDSSAFQYLAIDLIDVSTTNPRRTFDPTKLAELAESIREHGIIQPVVVRPKNNRFQLVAGERRYLASQIAERFSVPAHIKELSDTQAMEWQLIENAQRVDVHPYEEAQGYQRLLDMPGYDVAALAAKTGKSTSHIYSRLSLLQGWTPGTPSTLLLCFLLLFFLASFLILFDSNSLSLFLSFPFTFSLL